MVNIFIEGRKAFAYIRTSTTANQTSVDDQYNAIREYCQKHDVKLDSVYTVSGTPDFASEFLDQIIEEMHKNSCDTLIVSSVSRLGRKSEHVKADLEKLVQSGIHVYSVRDGLIADSDIIPDEDLDEDEEELDDNFSMSM